MPSRGVSAPGIQSSLISKLQMSVWNGSGSIRTHRDYMVDLRSQLRGAGLNLCDQTSYAYSTESFLPSLDLFITLYENKTYDSDLLCDEFVKYEMRQKLRATKSGRARDHGTATLRCSVSSRPRRKKRKKRVLGS